MEVQGGWDGWPQFGTGQGHVRQHAIVAQFDGRERESRTFRLLGASIMTYISTHRSFVGCPKKHFPPTFTCR
jgi:hypothetical protein